MTAETATTEAVEAPGRAAPAAPARGRGRPRALMLSLEALSAAVLAWIWMAYEYRVWNIRWSVPLYEYDSDARAVGVLLKTLAQTGWWTSNPLLGFPFGQHSQDFPAGGETVQLVALRILAGVTPSYGSAMNLYYLGGFGVVAAVTFLVYRQLRFSYPIALVGALIFTFLPYHYAHEQSHLTRSSYFFVPLACLLMLWTLSWRSRFLVDPDPPPGTSWRSNLRRGPIAATAALAVFLGISETMTTMFTLTLLAAAGVVLSIRWREPSRLVATAGVMAVLGATFLVASLPTLVYWAQHGKNPVAAARAPAEAEHYALKIDRMVLAQGDVRIKPWAALGAKSQVGSPIPSEGGQYLGILGIVGFVGGIGGLMIHGLRRRGLRRDARPFHARDALVDHSSLLMLLAVLFAVPGGLSGVFAALGFTQVRTWGRIEIVIAFLALAVTGVWFERLAAWLRPRVARPVPVLVALTLLVGAFGLYDSISPGPRDYKGMEASWVSDERFELAIDQRMPPGSAFFQLPIVQYPEVPALNVMPDYDEFRGYLHDHAGMKWSYGAVKGRPIADWQIRVRDYIGPIGALPALVGMGFDGIWIDNAGISDRGAKLRAELQEVLHTRPMISENGRLSFFDLTEYKRSLHKTPAQLRTIARRMLGIAPPPGVS